MMTKGEGDQKSQKIDDVFYEQTQRGIFDFQLNFTPLNSKNHLGAVFTKKFDDHCFYDSIRM